MILRHIHLPAITPYTHAAALQQRLVANLLAWKASGQTRPPPQPTVITAQFKPVYTCGRRDIGNVSKEQIEFLTSLTDLGRAEFHEALRGGQTTFHGPGQLVAYPVIDLKQHGLNARGHVCLLEKSVIDVLSGDLGVSAMTTENPGVWTDANHKICALGVHLRRNVSSHGIGLNVSTELAWFDRIVACGLEGKKTTSLARVLGVAAPSVDHVARLFVKQFVKRLQGIEAVESVKEGENGSYDLCEPSLT